MFENPVTTANKDDIPIREHYTTLVDQMTKLRALCLSNYDYLASLYVMLFGDQAPEFEVPGRNCVYEDITGDLMLQSSMNEIFIKMFELFKGE